jgi:hypothetical protein
MPRRTLMIYRENVSDAARELIKVVRRFNWEAEHARPITLFKRRA